MTDELPAQIEAFLFATIGWVKGKDLAARFGVNQRALRCTGDAPGLCTEFAISGNDGYRHFLRATDSEFAKAMGRQRGHGIRELVGVRRMRRKRASVLTTRAQPPAFIFERATGQGVLLVT